VKDININDLIDLIVADVSDIEGRLQKMFEWHFTRDLEIAKWVLGAAASFAVAFGIALFNAKNPPIVTVIAVLGLPAAIASYGFARLFRMRNIHRQYIAALKLRSQLAAIKPFISKLRDSYKHV
jgi:hypothetical protein